jgi:hypothetical protein
LCYNFPKLKRKGPSLPQLQKKKYCVIFFQKLKGLIRPLPLSVKKALLARKHALLSFSLNIFCSALLNIQVYCIHYFKAWDSGFILSSDNVE